jgi:phosphatidate phosphatase APP1
VPDWRDELRALAAALGRGARRAANTAERLVDRDPYHVVGYRGYGRAECALVLGRVLEDEGLAPPDASHSGWRNLVNAVKRLESDPLPGARVTARLGGASFELTADDEGYIRAWLPLATPLGGAGWHGAELALTDPAAPARPGAPPATAPVLVPPSDAAFGVISDLDDTVLQSEATRIIRAVRLVLLENARTRLPFAGVAAFYRALAAGARGAGTNPIFYVSNSPWNLYEVIADFLEFEEVPTGPLLLRDWDLAVITPPAPHKRQAITDILGTYPALPFIFVGDSGQADPEVYSAIVRENPGRVLAVYVRDVTRSPERTEAIERLAREVRAAGSQLVLAPDTAAVAEHAATNGWIAAERLSDIRGEARADGGARRDAASARGTPPP